MLKINYDIIKIISFTEAIILTTNQFNKYIISDVVINLKDVTYLNEIILFHFLKIDYPNL
jgi:hypothetical protein